jgi:hypothetical protein
MAATASAESKANTANLNGLWRDVAGPTFANCYLIISQDGTQARMTHYLEFNGTPMVEFGEGTVTGNKVHFKVKITQQIPGWATTGEHDLELSDDGNSLQGTFKDGKGNKGPLLFKRQEKMN